MDLVKRISVAAIWLLLAACSDEGTKSDTAISNEASVPDTGPADSAPAPDVGKPADAGPEEGGSTTGVTLQGTLQVYAASPPIFVSGAEVCIEGNASVPCATSAPGGKYTLTNVPDEDALIKYTHPDYYPMYASYGKGQPPRTFGSVLLTPTVVSMVLSFIGSAAQPGKGIMIIGSTYLNSGAEGTTFSLSPTSGEGPYYVDTYNLPDKSLTATTVAGPAFVVNVDPGVYTVTYTNSSLTCHRFVGWEDTPGSKLKIKIVADSATFASVACY